MQCVSEIKMPCWRNKQNNKSMIVSGLTSENKNHKTVFNIILPLHPCDPLCITFRSDWECFNGNGLTTFLFHVRNSLFLSTLCPIYLPNATETPLE